MSKKFRQNAARIAILFLVALYAFTLICAIFRTSFSEQLLTACVYLTFLIPIVMYVFMFIGKFFAGKKNPEDKPDDHA